MKCWCGGGVGPRFIEGQGATKACLESKFHVWDADGRPTHIRRLYIAGPMSNYPEANYPAFNEAAEQLRLAGYEVANPAEFGSEGGHYTDLLREDLRVMLDCDGVAMLDLWWESVGARNEIQVAGLLKMPCRSVSDWVRRSVLNDRIERLHGPGAVEAIDAAIADGSIFSEANQ